LTHQYLVEQVHHRCRRDDRIQQRTGVRSPSVAATFNLRPEVVGHAFDVRSSFAMCYFCTCVLFRHTHTGPNRYPQYAVYYRPKLTQSVHRWSLGGNAHGPVLPYGNGPYGSGPFAAMLGPALHRATRKVLPIANLRGAPGGATAGVTAMTSSAGGAFHADRARLLAKRYALQTL
jgi:hypothetical protein